ncbi:MAG: hypothetical protein O7D91_17790 [Planctomycetota bacterium]|nr:hypothetical protein [Planctomycetota bacterium]
MARKVVFKSRIKKAANTSLRAWEAGLRAIAPEMEAEMKLLVGKQTGPFGPPAPKFKPPRRRTGAMQAAIKVRVRKGAKGRAAALEVTGNVYARAQEFGRPEINMGPHPWARVVMLAGGRRGTKLKKKWTAKIARVARQKTKTSAKNRRR